MPNPILATLHPAILPLLVLLAVIAVFWGARKIAGLGKGGLDEFRKAREEIAKQIHQRMENQYWDQYDAGDKTDVTQRWLQNARPGDAPERPLWNRRHKLNFRRFRVVIAPRV